MGFLSRPIQLTFTSPAAPNGPAGTVMDVQWGLDDYSAWSIGCRLSQVAGGTLDFIFQTAYVPAGQAPSDFTGPWYEIARTPTVTAGAGTQSYIFGFLRDHPAPSTMQVSNTSDLAAPTIAVNVVYSWANGSAIRVICLAGTGVATSAVQSIFGIASQQG